eukprot:SAG31_NODE_524_length_14529_cov_23.084130_10_plen_40_part_00
MVRTYAVQLIRAVDYTMYYQAVRDLATEDADELSAVNIW